ncbi:histidinol-phosphatase [uncultured Clostridium sp.]|uniref:histidinol-phosphatase n=1 Tax=uncultured Clostridium sp. TaxID=59620 RepID=UPI00262CC083|nr:histidinol-phosphatase [uncultured Clostridium sp.]
MKTNYHTHNFRCKHASGNAEDYVKKAIEEGYDEIGLSDHMCHPGMDLDNKSRMYYEELPGYFREVNEAIEKYGDKISIKRGLECEYFPGIEWLYEELEKEYRVDYLILGAHFFKHNEEWLYVGWGLDEKMLEEYSDFVVQSMETGYFTYLAHPDLFFIIYKEWNEYSIKASRKILEAAEKMNMPLEININGYKKSKIKTKNGDRYPYPVKEFWELSKEYNVKRIIGVDAHNPKDLEDFNKGLEFAKSLDLEVIEKLDF